MATQPVQSAFGTDPESTAANEKWKQAYDQLIKSLDARQEKPFFDPTYLAAAQAFLTPKKTGSFFEGLGNVAGNVAKAQEAEQNRAIETAKARLDLAGMGIQQANQQAGMRDFYAGFQPSPQVSQQAGPQASQQAEKQTSPSSGILSSMGFEDQGVQVGPPQPLPTEKQFVGGKVATGMNAIDARMEYQKLLRDDLKVGPNGTVYQMSTGKMFAVEDPTPIEVPLLSLGGEKFSVTKKQANQLNAFTAAGNNQGRIDFENKIRGIGQPPPATTVQSPLQVTPMPTATGIVNAPRVAQVTTPRPMETAPEAPVRSALPPPTQAVGMRAPSEIERAKLEEAARRAVQQARDTAQAQAEVAAGQGAEAKRRETIGSEVGKLAVAEETKIAQNAENAGKLFTAADTVVNAVTKSKDYFGVFNKPGVLNAIGATIAEAAKPGGKFTIIDVEQKVLQSMPGTTKENLSDREKAASALAEIELGYTQNYLAKQGAVTEGERKIVRAIPGGLSSSPQFLEFKGKLIRERAQYDMNLNTAYTEYLRAKPNGDALDFKRNSPLYKEIHNGFERKIAELANTIPALPSNERPKQDNASSYAADLLKRRMQQ